MASWLALSFLVLLSANAVLSDTIYSDALIDKDPYLSNCIIGKATSMALNDGIKKIHSSPQCLKKTKIVFKVEEARTEFGIYNEQPNGLVVPAKIRYKFGDCPGLLVEVDKDSGGVFYNLHDPNTANRVVNVRGFEYILKRRNQGQAKDKIDVTTTWGIWGDRHFSVQCNVFRQVAGSSELLMDFEQEVELGVPDLTLLLSVKDTSGKNYPYFGTATAKDIIEPVTTTTTFAPSPALIVEEKKPFPWWIIGVAVGVALALLIILLVVGYLCWRSRRASKLKEAEKSAKSAFGATTQQDQSMYGPSLMKVEQDAKPVDPRAASSIASVAQSPAPN